MLKLERRLPGISQKFLIKTINQALDKKLLFSEWINNDFIDDQFSLIERLKAICFARH